MNRSDLRSELGARLNQLATTLSSERFLSRKGLGNEIAFYIFDYDAACEPLVEAYLPSLKRDLAASGLGVLELNLFTLVTELLTDRGFLDKALALEEKKGSAALAKGIGRIVRTDNLLAKIDAHLAQPHNLVLLTGVGAAWPLVRSHTVLNNLHAFVGEVPLVMFYPGTYSGRGLRLFSSLTDDNYYRAFPLLPAAA